MASLENKAKLFEALKNDTYAEFSASIDKEELFSALNEDFSNLLTNPILEDKSQMILAHLGDAIVSLPGGIKRQLGASQVYNTLSENPDLLGDKASQDEKQFFYNKLYRSLIDFDNKMVNIDALNDSINSFFNIEKKASADLFKNHISKVDKDPEFLYKVIIAFEKIQQQKSEFITEEQRNKMKKIEECILSLKEKNPEFFKMNAEKADAILEGLEFFNSSDIERSALEHIKKEELKDVEAGVISADALNTPLKKAAKNQEERDLYVDIDWEEKYAEFLEKNNYKIARFKDKAKQSMKTIAPFVENGFELVGHSIFGNSLVKVDESNNVEYSLLNVSPLTKTMRFTKVGENDPSSYIAAALNARKNGWATLYLNHPGSKDQAVRFLRQSIQAMVEVGNYDYDDIQVPRKYRYILEEMKSKNGLISNVKPQDDAYYAEEGETVAPPKEPENQKKEKDEVEFIDPRTSSKRESNPAPEQPSRKQENNFSDDESSIVETVKNSSAAESSEENSNENNSEEPLKAPKTVLSELDQMEDTSEEVIKQLSSLEEAKQVNETETAEVSEPSKPASRPRARRSGNK